MPPDPGTAVRIAVTVDPEIPVPPVFYGGVERIVDMLVRGLVKRGHDVTLFAHPDSDVPCRLDPYPGRSSRSSSDLALNSWRVSSGVMRGRYDLVHSFGRLAYLAPILPTGTPKIMSYQRAISGRSVAWGERLARGSLHFSGCSHFLVRRWAACPNWHVIHNAAPLDAYHFRAGVPADAPLLFLGRIEEVKGAHVAVEIARDAGRTLILAGNVPEGATEQAYFEREIRPYLDTASVQYVGPVNDVRKDELLGGAAALLMPIQWDEPFGIVMAEALACGTPVIGLGRGAVPEVIHDGLTGFVCGSPAEMVAAVGRIAALSRRECRRSMEAEFSDDVMVERYIDLYRRVVDGRR